MSGCLGLLVQGLRSPILVIKAVTLNHSSVSRVAESLRWIAGAAGHPAVGLRHRLKRCYKAYYEGSYNTSCYEASRKARIGFHPS